MWKYRSVLLESFSFKVIVQSAPRSNSSNKARRRQIMHIALIAIIIGAALVASVLLVMPYLTLGALRSDMPVRIFTFDPEKYDIRRLGDNDYSEPIVMSAVRVNDLKPNSFLWFLDPYGKTMNALLLGDGAAENKTSIILDSKQMEQLQKRDAYEYYMLIRLPEWLGGSSHDASSSTAAGSDKTYKNTNNNENSVAVLCAYNSISPSDKCVAKYFPEQGRTRIENPCAGDMFRAWDGFAIAGPAHTGYVSGVISKGYYPALPMLRLTVDNDGYVAAFRPDNNPRGDGVKGDGRLISPEELVESNRKTIAAASEYAGFDLPFPPTMPPDYVLDWIEPKPNSDLSHYSGADGGVGGGDSSRVIRSPLQATYFPTEINHQFTTIDAAPQK